MMKAIWGALQFLTVLPVRASISAPGETAVAFPLIGALLGASAGSIVRIFAGRLGMSLASLIAIAWLVMITGCLHEDGLADVADALRAGRTRQKMIEILKDSRVGTFGAVALLFSVGLRWQALAHTSVNPIAGMTAALALSRTSMVALSALTPAVGGGLGSLFAATCSRPAALFAGLESIGLAALCTIFFGWRCSVAMVSASVAVVLLARLYFVRRLQGVTGDCLGATCQAVEITNLLVLAWQPVR